MDQIAKGRDPLKSATACKWGHKFTPENTKIEVTGRRKCRTCSKLIRLARTDRREVLP